MAVSAEKRGFRGPEALALIPAAGAVGVVLAAGAFAAVRAPWLPVAAMLGALATVWCLQRPVRWVYLLVLAMFFESYEMSLYAAGARIRAVQLILLPALVTVALGVAGNRIRLARIPLLAPLLVYMAACLLSTFLAASFAQSLKIFLLQTSLFLIYVTVYILVRNDPAAWPGVFRLVVLTGLGEILYGLYQVAAGIANARLGTSLPIGIGGIAHVEYLGLYFGRPYGTLPEPDTFGVVCLYYALLLGLMWLTAGRGGLSGRFVFLGAVAATLGLLLGFVRAGWAGFLAGLVYAAGMRLAGRMRPVRALRLWAALLLLAIVCGAAVAFSPAIRGVLVRRFATEDETALGLQNVRFRQMLVSMRLFMGSPIVGNGPGSFSVLGVYGADEEYWAERAGRPMYDPSLATTLLNDTGLIGAGAFLVLCLAYFRHMRGARRRLAGRAARNAATAAHCALVGLFASFLFTQYFWMPFTWVFIAVTVLLAELPAKGPPAEQVATAPDKPRRIREPQ